MVMSLQPQGRMNNHRKRYQNPLKSFAQNRLGTRNFHLSSHPTSNLISLKLLTF